MAWPCGSSIIKRVDKRTPPLFFAADRSTTLATPCLDMARRRTTKLQICAQHAATLLCVLLSLAWLLGWIHDKLYPDQERLQRAHAAAEWHAAFPSEE